MITVSTDKKFKPEDFFHKTCRLGYNDIEFSMEYGYSCEFIGQLTPVENADEEYTFVLDKVEKRGAISFIKSLSIDDDEDYPLIIAALREDYGIENVIVR